MTAVTEEPRRLCSTGHRWETSGELVKLHVITELEPKTTVLLLLVALWPPTPTSQFSMAWFIHDTFFSFVPLYHIFPPVLIIILSVGLSIHLLPSLALLSGYFSRGILKDKKLSQRAQNSLTQAHHEHMSCLPETKRGLSWSMKPSGLKSVIINSRSFSHSPLTCFRLLTGLLPYSSAFLLSEWAEGFLFDFLIVLQPTMLCLSP